MRTIWLCLQIEGPFCGPYNSSATIWDAFLNSHCVASTGSIQGLSCRAYQKTKLWAVWTVRTSAWCSERLQVTMCQVQEGAQHSRTILLLERLVGTSSSLRLGVGYPLDVQECKAPDFRNFEVAARGWELVDSGIPEALPSLCSPKWLRYPLSLRTPQQSFRFKTRNGYKNRP